MIQEASVYTYLSEAHIQEFRWSKFQTEISSWLAQESSEHFQWI